MGYPVTLNGRTYTLADFSGQNYAAGFPDALEDFVTEAGTKVTAAASSATAAAASETAAAASAAAAAASVDAIEGFYLGAQASNPTVDLNGAAVTVGDFYFNTATNQTRIYDGANWNVIAPDLVGDSSPQLGGNLDVNGNAIVSTSNGNIAITPNGTGEVDISKVDIDGGAIDGTVIGASSAAAGTFTTFTSTGIDDNASATVVTVAGGSSGDNSIIQGVNANQRSGFYGVSANFGFEISDGGVGGKTVRIRNNGANIFSHNQVSNIIDMSNAASVTVAGFTSTGIDDNASSTSVTVSSGGQVTIDPAGSTQGTHELSVREADSPRITIDDINGTDTNVNAAILLRADTTNKGVIGYTGSDDLYVENKTAAGSVILGTNDVERLTVDSAGGVSVSGSGGDIFTLKDTNLTASASDIGNVRIAWDDSAGTRVAYVGTVNSDDFYINNQYSQVVLTHAGVAKAFTKSSGWGVTGGIDASGDVAAGASATGGVAAYAINYSGDHLLNVFGSLKSSGRTMLGYGVKPSTTTNNGYVSAAGNFSFNKAAIEVGGGTFFFKTSAGATDAVGDPVTMTSRFSVDVSGNGAFTGSVTVGDGTSNASHIAIKPADDTVAEDLQFYNGTTRIGEIGTQDSTWLRINQETAKNIYTPRYIRADGGLFVSSGLRGIDSSGVLTAVNGSTITGSGDTVFTVETTGTATSHDAVLRLKIGGTQGDSIIQFGDSGDTDVGRLQYDHSNNSMRFFTNAAEDMRLTSTGNLHVDADVIAFSTTISDERMKEDVQGITGALDTVDALRGVTYTWNTGSRKGQRDYGVIAQEVEQVIPEIVYETEMPLLGDEETLYKTVDYEKLCAVLISAVSELRAEVEALKRDASV